jgi:hypothetical protein
MSPLATLLARLDTCAWRLDRGDIVAADELHQLASAATAMGPTLTLPERAELAERVGRVCTALANGCRTLEARMAALRTGRRAVRAYGEASLPIDNGDLALRAG